MDVILHIEGCAPVGIVVEPCETVGDFRQKVAEAAKLKDGVPLKLIKEGVPFHQEDDEPMAGVGVVCGTVFEVALEQVKKNPLEHAAKQAALNEALRMADVAAVKRLVKEGYGKEWVGEASQHQDCIAGLAEILAVNTVVTKLTIMKTTIRPSDLERLAHVVRVNKTITSVCLYGAGIGDNGAAVMADALKSNKTVQVLDLDDNGLGDRGAEAVASALEVNESLTKVSLSNNNITDAGAICLARALARNAALRVLDLDKNNIAVEGTSSLGLALMSNANTSLRKLHLQHNLIALSPAASATTFPPRTTVYLDPSSAVPRWKAAASAICIIRNLFFALIERMRP